jgi:hypothetical protein
MPTSSSRAPLFLAAATAAAITILVGCESPLPTFSASSVQAGLDPELKTLRQATARYASFEQAQRDGYTFLFLDMCMVDQSPEQRGGMGYHYVNTDLLGGAQPEITKPQALLYEPAANGSLKLVAVEYVVPIAAWTGATPPRLFGQDFTPNAFGLYALHVWLYKENPSGMFADWNPTVSCGNATPPASQVHH